ncbi:MAG: diphosphate--fructose-6-phosphate 1-phosphotransferase [Terracidiphilus sp.]
MKRRNLLVVQSGGPTQMLNATLAAILGEAQACGAFKRIWGTKSGLNSLLNGEAIDLGRMSPAEIEAMRTSPGAALGSSRAKLSDEDRHRLARCLDANGLHDVLIAGGNGGMRGAEILSRHCRESGCEVRVLGVPKTVDNDIAVTDRCPGYASAARYVAQSTRDLGMDVRSLPQPVSILETLGRSVGWLAAAAAAGKRDEQDAPHLVYVPERAFEMEQFLAGVDGIVTRQGWAIVVVAEGIRDAKGQFVRQVADASQADPLGRPITGGVAQFLAEAVARNLKMRCRSEKPGLLGRASMLHAAAQDWKDAEMVGRAAVRGLLDGETDKMVALRPLSDPRECGYEYVPLQRVAEVEKPIPAEWTRDAAIPVTGAFLDYLRPLIGGLMPYCDPLSVEKFGCEGE